MTSPVNAADVPDNFKFCKENELCKLLSYKGKVFSVEIPQLHRAGSHPDRAGCQGQHCYQHPEARYR